MTIAELGLKIDSSQARSGAAALDQLTAAGKRAEEAAVSLGQKAQPGYGAVAAAAKRVGISVQEMQQRIANSSANLARNFPQWVKAQQAIAASSATLAPAQIAAASASVKLAQSTGMLSVEQEKAGRTSSNFITSLTRRFILGYITLQIRQMTSSLVSLNSELAKTADVGRFTGFGGQAIQGLVGAAANKGIDTGQFLDDITAFAKRVQEAKAGIGDLGALLRVNGIAVKDTEDAFFHIADLVKSATGDYRTQASILEQAGLPATREMIKFLEQGAPAIRKQSAEIDKLSEQQLRDAQKLENRFNELWANFVRFAKKSIVDTAHEWELFLSTAGGNPMVPPAANTAAKKGLADINEQLSKLRQNLDALQSDQTVPGIGFVGVDQDQLNLLKAQIDALERRRKEILANAAAARAAGGAPSGVPAADVETKPGVIDPKIELGRISRQQQIISLLGDLATVEERVRQAELQLQAAGINGIAIDDKRRAKLLELTRERALGIDTIRAQTDATNVEIATFGMSVGAATAYQVVQAKINEERRKGNELLPQEIADLQKWAEAAGAAAQQLDDMRYAAGLTSSFVKDFKNDLMQGKSAWESFGHAAQNVLNKIADKLIDMAINNLFAKAFGGAGGGGGFLSSIFSALFSGGPAFSAHGLYHEGGIAGQPKQTRYVHPAYFDDAPRYHSGGIAGLAPDEVPAILRRGEPVFKSMQDARDKVGTNVSVGGTTIVIQGDANEKTVAQMRQILDDDRRQRPAEIVKVMREARRHEVRI